MLMGILSALGIAENLIHDYHSKNEGMEECNRHIAILHTDHLQNQ